MRITWRIGHNVRPIQPGTLEGSRHKVAVMRVSHDRG